MKRHVKTATFCLGLLLIAGSGPASDPYRAFTDREYGFTIKVPASWKTEQVDLGYRRLIICSKSRSTDIVISASRQNLEDIEKWDNWEKWYTSGRNFSIRRIIESKNVLLEKNMVGKILLFEYGPGGSRILQRVLISKFSDTLIIVECRAPVSTYYRYSDTFTTVMGSLSQL